MRDNPHGSSSVLAADPDGRIVAHMGVTHVPMLVKGKPLLFGRGVKVPMLVIFLGAIGGMISMGIVGLFLGAVVLALGYELFMAWLEEPDAAGSEASA